MSLSGGGIEYDGLIDRVDSYLEYSQDRRTAVYLPGDECRTGIWNEEQPIGDTTKGFASSVWGILERLCGRDKSGQGGRSHDQVRASRVTSEHLESKHSLGHIYWLG